MTTATSIKTTIMTFTATKMTSSNSLTTENSMPITNKDTTTKQRHQSQIYKISNWMTTETTTTKLSFLSTSETSTIVTSIERKLWGSDYEFEHKQAEWRINTKSMDCQDELGLKWYVPSYLRRQKMIDIEQSEEHSRKHLDADSNQSALPDQTAESWIT